MESDRLADKFGGLTTTDGKDNSLFQVMMAVEVAEATIKQQVEENNRLRAELQKKDQELEHIKVDRTIAYRHYSVEQCDEHGRDSVQKSEGRAEQFYIENQSGISRNNGSLTAISHGQTITESATASVSPCRYPMDGEYETHINAPGQGMMYMAESHKSSNIWKQFLRQKINDHEQEIMQLKKHLTQYAVREAQIQNEKSVLDKRIAQMQMAFDQQQQDLVGASSKAHSYRQDIIEENVRLAYALQDAQQDQTIYTSLLLPLLAEYSLQPQVLDAHSVISSVKVLFKHLQEKLIITEAKLKDSQYQLTPWHPDGSNSNSYAPSPQNFHGGAPTSSKIGLHLASQTTYPSPNVANSDAPTGTDWDIGGIQDQQTGLSGRFVRRTELADTGRYSRIASRLVVPKCAEVKTCAGSEVAQEIISQANEILQHGFVEAMFVIADVILDCKTSDSSGNNICVPIAFLHDLLALQWGLRNGKIMRIMDKHLEALALKYLDTKFIMLDAEGTLYPLIGSIRLQVIHHKLGSYIAIEP